MTATDNGQLRHNIDRALMIARAIRHNPTPSESESSYQFTEPLFQRFVRNVVPFILFFVKLFASVLGLGLLSIVTYWTLYSAVIMRGLEVQSHPIFFDYSAKGSPIPLGRVDLQSTSNAPWVYACGNSKSEPNFCVKDGNREVSRSSNDIEQPSHNKVEAGSVNPILSQGQRYFVDVVLTLPESEVNKKLGVFMLTVDLRSRDGILLARSKQSSLFPYESRLVGLARKLIMLLPLVSGIIEETKTISLLCFDNYMDTDNLMTYAEVGLEVPHLASYPVTTQAIQVSSAEFHYGKMMSPLQRFFRRWSYFCAIIGVCVLFLSYTAISLHVASRRGWLLNRHAYYPGGIFGSDNDLPYNFSNESQQSSWIGPDVEILDGADDEDAWEPLHSSSEENANKSAVIPDDNTVNSENESAKLDSDVKPTITKCSLGPLSQNPDIQNHETMPSSNGSMQNNGLNEDELSTIQNNTSTIEEEKYLADMVMNGFAKYEVFTGEYFLF